jgi:hypothetical protein
MFDSCYLFVIGGLLGLGVQKLLQGFAAQNPDAVGEAKKKAEAKAIEFINRILK